MFKGNEPVSATTAKQRVDYNQVFAALSGQFESCCQVESFDKQSPLSGWFEHSKKLQWRRTTPGPSSESAVPDFTSVVKKMKDDFNSHGRHCNVDDEQWLVPRGAQQQSEWLMTSNKMVTPGEAVTRGFDAIARSDSSLWLPRSSSDDGLLSEHHDHFIADTSPWLLQSSSSTERQARPSVTPLALEQDYSEWLKPVMEVEQCQPWLSITSSKEDDVSNWLQAHHDQCNEQWLLPRG